MKIIPLKKHLTNTLTLRMLGLDPQEKTLEMAH